MPKLNLQKVVKKTEIASQRVNQIVKYVGHM